MIGEGHWNDECGVCGIIGNPEASTLAYLGIHALQHRGQESAGIVSSEDHHFHSYRQMGHVADIFNRDVLARLPGDRAIGHVRYSTTGSSILKNAQPFVVETAIGPLAIAHNGNFVNAAELRAELEAEGSIFQSTMDTEVVVHLMARSRAETVMGRLLDALSRIRGAYSMLVMTNQYLFAVRDPSGFRPLVIGKSSSWHAVASETCALDLIEAKYVGEVEPGEIVIFGPNGIERFRFAPSEKHKCVFELVYFSRPDSFVFGEHVYSVRKEFGRQLAREAPANADIVIAIPDSGVPAAMGYAEQSGLSYEIGLVRNHYVGRTFIEPEQSIRDFGVRLKLNAVSEVLKGKRVVVVDDSIVRGTTGRKIIRMIREAGAAEIHVRISSPPITHPCFYGIDTPKRDQLIASTHSVDETAKFMTCDSLRYLSMDGMLNVAGEPSHFCTACFSGNYPVQLPEEKPKRQMQLFEL